MNIKLASYIGVVVLLIGFVTGEWFAARNYQRNIDLTAPADTVVVQLPPVTKTVPAETTIVMASPRPVKAIVVKQDSTVPTVIDSLEEKIADLEQPARVTIRDNHGGTHDIKYDPKTDEFTEVYTPVIVLQPEERLITRNLSPIEGQKWWVESGLLYQSGPGLSITLGRGEIGVIWGNIGQKPLYGVALHLTL